MIPYSSLARQTFSLAEAARTRPPSRRPARGRGRARSCPGRSRGGAGILPGRRREVPARIGRRRAARGGGARAAAQNQSRSSERSSRCVRDHSFPPSSCRSPSPHRFLTRRHACRRWLSRFAPSETPCSRESPRDQSIRNELPLFHSPTVLHQGQGLSLHAGRVLAVPRKLGQPLGRDPLCVRCRSFRPSSRQLQSRRRCPIPPRASNRWRSQFAPSQTPCSRESPRDQNARRSPPLFSINSVEEAEATGGS